MSATVRTALAGGTPNLQAVIWVLNGVQWTPRTGVSSASPGRGDTIRLNLGLWQWWSGSREAAPKQRGCASAVPGAPAARAMAAIARPRSAARGLPRPFIAAGYTGDKPPHRP